MNKMILVYSGEKPPDKISRSIFLAGPTTVSKDIPSWRPKAIEILEAFGYDGVVFIPEPRPEIGKWPKWTDEIEWEERYLNMADCVLFWVPRNLKFLPGFTTNTEWGVWENSGKAVFGAPDGARKVHYQKYYAEKLKVPTSNTLQGTIQAALNFIGEGLERIGGAREIPLYIWRTPHFQWWYQAQIKKAGNRLDGARVEWTFRLGLKKNIVFFCVLHVDIFVTNENRHKTNEVVFFQPDINAIVMYHKRIPFEETEIILIREFRSPAATRDGFVWGIPEGLTKVNEDLRTLAAQECEEETGLKIDRERIKYQQNRQLVANLSTHKAYVFSVEITDEELKYLYFQQGVAHGIEKDSERTFVEIKTLKEIQENEIDWSTLGMIWSVLRK